MPLLEKTPNLINDFKNVPELSFFAGKLDGLQVCQKILQANPGVKHLTLSASAFKESADEPPEDLQDSSTRAGLISRTVFSHLQPFDVCSPLMLTFLRLERMSLRYATDTYLRIIKFSNLKTLELYKCEATENLFAQLSKPHIRPRQLKYICWMQRRINEPHVLEAFEGLLESLLGLEWLDVDIETVNRLPKAEAITRHGKTLSYLSINGRGDDDNLSYDPADFTAICISCPELVQLSIAFPYTLIDTATVSPDYTTFLVRA